MAVSYTRCGLTKPVIRRFTNQIIVTPSNFGHLARGGDSGSVVREATNPCPRYVGLLFAGTQSATVVNSMDTVLTALSARLGGIPLSILGCTSDELTFTAVPLAESLSSGATASSAAAAGVTASSFNAAVVAKRNNERHLLGIAGVVGTGIGRHHEDPAQATVEILIEKDSPDMRSALPTSIDGVPCHVIETGRFIAF